MQIEWPPPYNLRKSTRAKRVRLQITAKRGLEVIVPSRFNPKKAPLILDECRDWIERTWLRTANAADKSLPDKLPLLALGEEWKVHYCSTELPRINVILSMPGQLMLQGAVHQQDECKDVLRKWLIEQAKQHFLPWLAQLSASTGLIYSDVSIRGATTRWGSCSAQKRISLSYQLLFLPPQLVQHVLLHELCHLKHLNHSQCFWQLLKHFDKDFDVSRRKLRKAQEYVPAWV